MARVKFTAGEIGRHECAAGRSQSFIWDAEAPGLGLRATANGAKSFMFQGKLFQGKADSITVRITIGDTKTWDIASARREARRLKGLIDKGDDPRSVRDAKLSEERAGREAKAAAATAEQEKAKRETVTLGVAWPVYIEERRNAGRKGWSDWHLRDHENVVRRGGQPKVRGNGLTEPGPLATLLDVRLIDLTGKRIGQWLAAEAQARPTQAALAFRLLSVFANWCESHHEYAGLVPAGACKAQQVRDQMPAKNTKDGDSLQREQLALWFKAVLQMSNPVQSAYLQALLLTGARRRELAALRWQDVDFRWMSMTIRDKVEGERTIPLTPYVAHLLVALPRRNEWVFSSPASANGQLAEPTPGHKRALVAAGLPDLTLHGLRRSFGSLAEWTETPAGVVAQIMGHKPSAIAEKHYRRRPLDLLRQWHAKLEAWILAEAGIEFEPVQQLRVVASA